MDHEIEKTGPKNVPFRWYSLRFRATWPDLVFSKSSSYLYIFSKRSIIIFTYLWTSSKSLISLLSLSLSVDVITFTKPVTGHLILFFCNRGLKSKSIELILSLACLTSICSGWTASIFLLFISLLAVSVLIMSMMIVLRDSSLLGNATPMVWKIFLTW